MDTKLSLDRAKPASRVNSAGQVGNGESTSDATPVDLLAVDSTGARIRR